MCEGMTGFNWLRLGNTGGFLKISTSGILEITESVPCIRMNFTTRPGLHQKLAFET
jgi:hypothetical protein